MREVGIQCTIGPSCNDPEILTDMMEAGMGVARVNLSHGSAASQEDKLINFRRAARRSGTEGAAVMYDLRGPEIRIGEIPGGSLFAAAGETLMLRCESAGEDAAEPEYDPYGNEFGSYTDHIVRVSYGDLCREVKVGTQILIDDGKVSLTVESVRGQDIICYVDRGGQIAARKGVNVPDVKLQMEYLGADDKEDILWCVEHGADYIAGSFIRRAEDVRAIRRFLDENGGIHVGVIAKIECKEALSNLDAILNEADQILIARGDLGVEIGFACVPAVQKRVIRKCRELGKAVIVATQLIDSMKTQTTPTRAEVSDIANAVFDGASDLLVTGETAEGRYPVQVVREMGAIIDQAILDVQKYGEEIL